MKIQLEDKSIFIMEDECRLRAFNLTYGKLTEEFEDKFRELTAQYWNKKMEPTKFGDEGWKTEYKTQAELAEKVMYQYMRPAILAVAMEMIAKDMGLKSAPKVLALGKDGATEYTGHSVKKSKW